MDYPTDFDDKILIALCGSISLWWSWESWAWCSCYITLTSHCNCCSSLLLGSRNIKGHTAVRYIARWRCSKDWFALRSICVCPFQSVSCRVLFVIVQKEEINTREILQNGTRNVYGISRSQKTILSMSFLALIDDWIRFLRQSLKDKEIYILQKRKY